MEWFGKNPNQMDSYSKIQHSFRMVRDGREKKKEPANPYMDMFSAVDISSYSEVLYIVSV